MILLSDYMAGGAIRKLQLISSGLITESTEWVAPSNGLIIVTASGAGGGGAGYAGRGRDGGSTVITIDPDHVLTLGGGEGGKTSTTPVPEVGAITTSPEWSLYPSPLPERMQGLPSYLGLTSQEYGNDGFTNYGSGAWGGGGGSGDQESQTFSGVTSFHGNNYFGMSRAAYGASIVKSPFQVKSGQTLLVEIGSGGSGGAGGVGERGRNGGNGYVHIQFFKQD